MDQRAAAAEGDEAGVVRGAAAQAWTMAEIRKMVWDWDNTPVYVDFFFLRTFDALDQLRLRICVLVAAAATTLETG